MVQAFGDNLWFEVADLPCRWDVCEEQLVVGYWFWEWLVKGKWRLKVRRENTPNRHPSMIRLLPRCCLDSSVVVVDSSTSC